MGLTKRRNTWWIDIRWKGRRIRNSLKTGNRRTAERIERDIREKLELGEYNLSTTKNDTFEAFSERYLGYSQTNKAESTYVRDRYTIQLHLMPVFGHLLLTEIQPEQIEAYKSQRLGKCKPSTVNKELSTLKAMLRTAVDWGTLKHNPAATVKKLPESEQKIRFLSQVEINRLLDASRDKTSPDWMYAFVSTALYCGLRKSELFNLHWGDVNFEHGMITVQPRTDWHTKNYKKRIIPLHSSLKDALISLTRHPTSPYVFCNSDGSSFHDIRGSFGSILKRADIAHLTLHEMRHTFASHLVMNGTDLPTVQTLMGHADIKTTMRYSHLAPEHLHKAVQNLYVSSAPTG